MSSMSGASCLLTVRPWDTVATLKALIQKQLEIPIEDQSIVHGSCKLAHTGVIGHHVQAIHAAIVVVRESSCELEEMSRLDSALPSAPPAMQRRMMCDEKLYTG